MYLVMSPGGGGSAEDFERAKKYMTNIHLADRDIQHHHWANDGAKTYLADANPLRHIEAQYGAKEAGVPLRLRILLSFHYYKDTDLDTLFAKYFTPPYPEVFIDSGGFSAMTQGATIDIDAYCLFIKRFRHLITTYANLDAIGDAKKTLTNQKKMESKGLQPIPVFHVNEPISYLKDYIAEYPYIALGGMVPHMRDAKRKLMPWLIQCFKLAQGKSVFHGFGCTSWEVVKALAWYSVDSSSWGMGFRYGQVPLFDERAGRFVDVKLGNHAECFAKARLIRALGFDPADFADRSRNDRAKICAISALSYLKAERWLRRRHGNISIPTREDETSSRLKSHLATGSVLGSVEQQADYYPRGLGMAHDMTTQDVEDATSTSSGLKTYLSDTSNGLNYRDADAGLKMHLVTGADGDGSSPTKGGNMSIAALGQSGLKTYLVDARQQSGSEIAAADDGLRMYLAEHSLDRGGLGDTSRALDILTKDE